MAKVCTLIDSFRIKSSWVPIEDGKGPAVHMNGGEFFEYLKKHQFHIQNSSMELDALETRISRIYYPLNSNVAADGHNYIHIKFPSLHLRGTAP